MRATLWSALLVLIVGASAWGFPSHRPEQDCAQGCNQQAAPDLRGTPQPPVVVEIVHTEADKEEARRKAQAEQAKANEEHELVDATWWLVRVTFALAVFTAFLFAATWKVASDAHAISKSTIDSNRRAERAYVVVEVAASGIATAAVGGRFQLTTLTFQFVNHGRTPATLLAWSDDYVPTDRGAMPDPVIAVREVTQPPGSVVAPQGGKFPVTTNLFGTVPFDTGKRLANGTGSLWFIGYVRYADVWDRIHVTGFCAVYDTLGQRFVLRGDNRYNYTYEEKT